MLLGRYRHTIDAKKRLFIPAKFREELGDRFVLARDVADNCLNAYPLAQWDAFVRRVNELPSVELRRMRQFIYSNACDAEVDAMGRVIISQQLCEAMGFKKEVIITGMGDFAQIWDIDEWNKLNGTFGESGVMESMTQKLIELGF